MNVLCILLALAFWASVLLRTSGLLRFVLFMLAGVVGAFFSIAGGLSYWWDRSMQPGKASAIPFVCGLLILASQIPVFIRSLSARDASADEIGDVD